MLPKLRQLYHRSRSSMRSLPPFLVAEIRHAFQTCSRQHLAWQRTQFSTLQPRLRHSKPPKNDDNLPIQVIHSRLQAKKRDAQSDISSESEPHPDSKELVPRQKEQRSLDGVRKVPVPLKVIPDAEIAPGLTLSPKERLHIEQLTRRLPPRQQPKVYKKRIRIYMAGNGRIYLLTLARFMAIIGFTLVTVIVVPAHWVGGTSSLLMIAGLWLAGAVPFFALNWLLRPMVTEIFLQLPTTAQASPKLAMAYAKSLPADATLDLRFMRNLTITDVVSVKLANTRPIKSFIRPVSFEWIGPLVNRGNFLRPNPTQFYVRPQSAGGRATRDVTPGLWSKVYERLVGVESSAVSRWRR